MRYADVNGTRVSMLGMAIAQAPSSAAPASRFGRRAVQDAVDRGIELGVNLFEVPLPASRGAVAASLGRALARHPRDSYLLAAEFRAELPGCRQDFERTLHRAGAGRIDLCVVRGAGEQGMASRQGEAGLGFLVEQRRAGRIGQLGLAPLEPGDLAAGLARDVPWDFVQLRVSRRGIGRASVREVCEAACEAGLPVIVGPVRLGASAGLGVRADAMLRAQEPRASIASWGMRWAMGLPGVRAVVATPGSRAQAEDAARVVSYASPLGRRELKALATALAVRDGRAKVPCTACELCVDDCPRAIDIPGVLAAFNGSPGRHGTDVPDTLAVEGAWHGPEACVSCGACAEVCPQRIDVPALMRKMA